MPNEGDARRFTVAAYGYVSREGGSVASADSVVLEHLLRRGHRVDLYAIEGFTHPAELDGLPGYRLVPVGLRSVRAGWRVVDRLPVAPLTLGYSLASNRLHERAIARRIATEHRARPYDALLALGLMAPFRVAGLPCVSWPQGPPRSEWRALRTLRPSLRRYVNPATHAALALLYAHKHRESRRQLGHSDRILCGSRWAAGEWRDFGAPEGAVRPVPYPFDLDQFRPVTRDPEDPPVFRFLWLGRIVPRKRLDLMLEAFKRLRADRDDVELLVIGRFAYAKGLARLLDEYADVPGLDYRPSVARDDVPGLLRRVDAVVQPSENENLGSSVLEGLACGLPAVVGPTNGTQDYLGASSVVFDAYHPDALKDAMARLIPAVRNDRAAVAADCRAAAERFLTADAVASQVEAVLAEVAARPSP